MRVRVFLIKLIIVHVRKRKNKTIIGCVSSHFLNLMKIEENFIFKKKYSGKVLKIDIFGYLDRKFSLNSFFFYSQQRTKKKGNQQENVEKC